MGKFGQIAWGIAIPIWLAAGVQTAAQDFLLEGCFWRCSAGDSATAHIRSLQREAPGWAHAGFTGLLLPEVPEGQTHLWPALAGALRNAGLEPVAGFQAPPPTGGPEKLLADAKNLRDRYRVRNVHIGPGLEAWHFAALLNVAISENSIPPIAVADPGRRRNAQGIAAWINAVYDQIPDTDVARVSPRAFDHPLQEALYKAGANPAYDVRALFSAGLRDATSLTGFNALTYVNASFLSAAEVIPDPLPAYAWILSNNQLGLPVISLNDYRDPELKDAINQLLEAHRKYIFNSTEVEYLNRPGTDRRSLYLSAGQGADERRALIFQMEGRNTRAGRESPGQCRDVLAVINFSDAPLKVIHELNPSNLRPGDRFYDVLGLSDTPELLLDAGKAQGIAHAVYIELPPRSYSLWVQGEASVVLPGEIRFNARRDAGFIELTWEAPSEPSIRFFELERSTDGGVFERIAVAKALWAAQEAAYLHLDESVERGRRYAYRVKAVKEGGFFFSPVSQVEIPAERIRFEIAPGAVQGERILRVRSNVGGEAQMRLLDKAGSRVHAENFTLQPGEARRVIPTGRLAPGIYILEIRMNGERVWAERMLVPKR